ncbi:MAG: hypothetical protein LQ337_000579 [Flavoplaca oasis]|nr:MAG: hypothetical protein LQ337_000579 [Flavoplaca oasis]
MRLLVTSVLLSLPLASLATVEGGAPGAEPTTTLTSTSTQTFTRTMAGNTVTSILPSGEATPPAEGSPSAAPSSSAEAVNSESSPEDSITTVPLVPSETSVPDVIVSTSISTSATGAPYPMPETSGGNFSSGAAVPTGTGAPIVPPQGIEPFEGAGPKLGRQNTLMILGVTLVASLVYL